MIAAIGECVKKYGDFVNETTLITGKYSHHIPGFYDDKSIEYIKNDVEFSIAIIYIKTAVDYGLETALEKAIKKILGID